MLIGLVEDVDSVGGAGLTFRLVGAEIDAVVVDDVALLRGGAGSGGCREEGEQYGMEKEVHDDVSVWFMLPLLIAEDDILQILWIDG